MTQEKFINLQRQLKLLKKAKSAAERKFRLDLEAAHSRIKELESVLNETTTKSKEKEKVNLIKLK